MRLNIYLNDELVKKVDNQAKSLSISRSSYIAMALSQKLQSDLLVSNLPDILNLAKSMEENKK